MEDIYLHCASYFVGVALLLLENALLTETTCSNTHMVQRYATKIGWFRRPNITDWVTFVGAAVFSLGALGLGILAPHHPFVVATPFLGFAVAIALWRYPIIGLFTLFVGATFIENYRQRFPDATTENLPFWRNLSSDGIAPLPVSPAELLMIGALVAWFLRNLFAQSLAVRGSALFRSYGWYLLVVAMGLVHGVLEGGNTTIALWEIRTQFYGIIIFLLALNLLKTKAHFELLGWIIILGTGLKGLQGTIRYFVTFGGHFEGNALLAHDEAFFFPAYYVFVLLLFMFAGAKRQKQVGILLLPFVVIADFANNRRTSTALLVICFVALTFILFTVLKHRRLHISGWAWLALVLGSIYAAAFWNSSSTFAQPIQAIKSQIAPTTRDRNSDLYREQEDHNLLFAVKQSPIVGQGYGIRMDNVAGMVDLSGITELLFYMPHNSILWVWWRVGLLGFVLFWVAMGLAIVRNCFLARAATDPYLRRWAVFAAMIMIMRLLIGWWDQGLFMYRLAIYVWIVMAVPEILGGQLLTGWSASSASEATETKV